MIRTHCKKKKNMLWFFTSFLMLYQVVYPCNPSIWAKVQLAILALSHKDSFCTADKSRSCFFAKFLFCSFLPTFCVRCTWMRETEYVEWYYSSQVTERVKREQKQCMGKNVQIDGFRSFVVQLRSLTACHSQLLSQEKIGANSIRLDFFEI